MKGTHLLTTPGFATKLGLNLVAMTAAVVACGTFAPTRQLALAAYDWVTYQLMGAAHRAAWWWAIGLLSSSCCALQILLNALSLGCAGFNNYLGPVRPSLVAATLLTQALTWTVAYNRPWQWPAAATSSAVAITLTFLPEALALWQLVRSPKTDQTVARAESGGSKEQDDAVASPAAAVVLQFHLPTMGCISCVTAVTQALEADAAVAAVESVVVETGLATVRLVQQIPASDSDEVGSSLATIEAALRARLAAAGFPAAAAPDAAAADCCSPGTAKPTAATAPAAPAGHFGAAVLAGLLSSSCCLLQLALNLLAVLNMAHIGCAGFNKLLGPWRLELRLLTAAYLGGLWLLALRKRWPVKPLLLSTALAVVLALLPELLKAAGGPALAPPVDSAATELLKLQLNGMGCEACQLHVKGVLERADGVIAASVDFEHGTAAVLLASGWGNFNLTSLGAKLAYDGYEIVSSSVERAVLAGGGSGAATDNTTAELGGVDREL